MSVPCCHLAADEVVRTETATQSPSRRHLAKGGSWVSWGSWGCVGVLRFRPERASGVWLRLRKSNFRYLHKNFRNRPKCASTPQKPNFRLSNRSCGWPAGVILHSTCKTLPQKGRITKFRTAGAIFVIRHLVAYLKRTSMVNGTVLPEEEKKPQFEYGLNQRSTRPSKTERNPQLPP